MCLCYPIPWRCSLRCVHRDQREEPRQQRPAPERSAPAQQPAAQQAERPAEKQQPAQPAAAASQTNDRVQAQSDQVGFWVTRHGNGGLDARAGSEGPVVWPWITAGSPTLEGRRGSAL